MRPHRLPAERKGRRAESLEMGPARRHDRIIATRSVAVDTHLGSKVANPAADRP